MERVLTICSAYTNVNNITFGHESEGAVDEIARPMALLPQSQIRACYDELGSCVPPAHREGVMARDLCEPQ